MTPPNGTSAPVQVTPPPAPSQQTTGTTYIPLPIPATPKPPTSVPGAILALSLIIVLSLAARFLWRLPERLRHKQWVQDLGGAVVLQNRLLHALGYLGFVAGIMTNAYAIGIIVAGVMMLAANTRPQSDSERR